MLSRRGGGPSMSNNSRSRMKGSTSPRKLRSRLARWVCCSAAVGGHFDDDAAGVVVGVEPQLSFYRLAVRAPHVSGFDAVIERIAYQVHERIADLFDHGLVEFGFRAGNDELDVFADFLADVAHHALEAAERLADLHHAQLQGAVADFLH